MGAYSALPLNTYLFPLPSLPIVTLDKTHEEKCIYFYEKEKNIKEKIKELQEKNESTTSLNLELSNLLKNKKKYFLQNSKYIFEYLIGWYL